MPGVVSCKNDRIFPLQMQIFIMLIGVSILKLDMYLMYRKSICYSIAAI